MRIELSTEQLLYLYLGTAILIFLLIFLVVALFITSRKRKKAITNEQKINSNYKLELERAHYKIDGDTKNISALQNKLARLSIYDDMPDAFAELEERKKETEEQLKETSAKVKDTTKESNLVLKQARERADSILESADIQAKNIAGDAWEAKHKSEEYKKTALAMKNIIKGYGDEYLIPNETLIDDLADEYSFEEAGRQLKIVRNQTKFLIKDGQAADCDYKEEIRRQRSIEFALDAYNGKAETILAKAKSDNYGIMKKKLEDAFQLVNHNGLPFKNARILPRYADLYHSQLKYSIQTKELKKRDKEEQQRIKTEMREEERAQREYKKAQQQAEKEQKMILKAVKEAEEMLAKSVDAERLEFQSQLDKLMGKLSEAESRNQRVMSMAQQTKQGHVYVISNIGAFGENVVKIGMTRRLEPLDRVKELGDASVPFNFDVHAIIYSDDAPKLERLLHTKFHDGRVNRVNLRKEFFSINLQQIKNEIDALELKCHWTIKAEALEYRESIQLKKLHDRSSSLQEREFVSG